MIEIYCKLTKTIKIDKNDFYVFYDIKNKEENLIPCNIIDEFIDIDFTKPQLFLKENINGKKFIRFIHPDYKIGDIVRFPIIEKFENKYLLESKYFKQLTVDSFIWQEDFYDVECKIVGYKGNKPVLRNIDTRNSKWKINENYLLKILDYSSINNQKGEKINTVVVDCTGIAVNVRASDWHSKELWKHEDIECKVIGISKDGTPKLLINDNRHPIFKIGKEYSFTIIDLISKKLKSGTSIKVFKLKGLDKLTYEIQAFTDLEEKFKIGDEIECEVSDINTTVYLRYIFKKDQYFYDFQDIVKSNIEYDNFFKPCIEDENPIFDKLKEQYFSKSGFWVFTYCNQIIPYIKKNLIERRNLSKLINLLEVLTTVEKWILQKGILKAFENELERKITKNKIEKILNQSCTEIKCLRKFLDFKEFELLNGTLEEVLYYVKYSNVENLDYQKLIQYFKSRSFIEKDEIVILKNIEFTINSYRKKNRIINDNNYFIVNKDLKYSPKKINNLCLLLYSQIIINTVLNNIERVNFLKSKLYRIYSYSSKDKELKKALLLNSFFLLNNLDKENEFFFNLKENNICLDVDKVIENPNLLETSFDEKKSFHLSKILRRNNHGFDIIIDNAKGFLPIQNVYDNELKKKRIENLDWDTNVEITAFSKEFNFFISKQLDINSANYLSKNNKENLTPDFKIKYYGKIKNITDYGIFVTTEFGDGLIHISQIATHFIDEFFLNLHFKVGQILPFYFVYYKENKLELSLLKLNENGFCEEYEELFSFGEMALYDFSSGKFDNNNDTSLSNNIEIDKAYVLESYAILLFDLNEKIDILKLSKALYSNTKNSRSYLINIYIDYFHSLISLDSLINNYSVEKYEKFREVIIEIKERINQKTLESYPEAKNLSFFVDLLSLFNKTDDNNLESLFNLTKLPLEENNQLLKVVSKTVLANNLILSETEIKNYEDVNKFTLKNLKRIRQFISQGILSLEETVDDIRENELEMTRLYWKKRIEEDEGEDLEFKSTLLTPIPNREKIKIISGLKEKLKIEKSEEKIKKLKSKIEELNNSETNDKLLEKKIIHSALKTICAFANTNGGSLLLGVSDDKKIFGLELDYNKVNKKLANRDEFGKRFDEILKDYFGNSFSSSLLKKEFLKFPEGDILIVNVSKSLDEVFLLKDENGNKKESLYIRNLSSSERLDGIELAKFIKKRHLNLMNLKVEL